MIQIVVEFLAEVVFEAVGWTLSKRWGRLLLGCGLGLAGGFGYSLLVDDAVPVVAILLVGAQIAAIPLLAGRELFGRRLDRQLLVDLVLIGASVVAGRFLAIGIT